MSKLNVYYDPVTVKVEFKEDHILISQFKGFTPNLKRVSSNFLRRFKFGKEAATKMELIYDNHGNYSIKIVVMFQTIIAYIQNAMEAIDMKVTLWDLDPYVFTCTAASA